jgi:hypothetical protein
MNGQAVEKGHFIEEFNFYRGLLENNMNYSNNFQQSFFGLGVIFVSGEGFRIVSIKRLLYGE